MSLQTPHLRSSMIHFGGKGKGKSVCGLADPAALYWLRNLHSLHTHTHYEYRLHVLRDLEASSLSLALLLQLPLLILTCIRWETFEHGTSSTT